MTVNFSHPPGDQDAGREGRRWTYDRATGGLRPIERAGDPPYGNPPEPDEELAPVSELEREQELHHDIRVRAEDRLERLQHAEAKLERVEAERDKLAEGRADQMQAIIATQQRAEAAESRYETLRGGVEGEVEVLRGLAAGSRARGDSDHGWLALADHLTALLDQKGEPDPQCQSDGAVRARLARKLKEGACETCGGSRKIVARALGTSGDRCLEPCPDCTTGKQVEAGIDAGCPRSRTGVRQPASVDSSLNQGGGDAHAAAEIRPHVTKAAVDVGGGLEISWDDWSLIDVALAFASEYSSREVIDRDRVEELRPRLRAALGHAAPQSSHVEGEAP